jgi:hypothetical protein
MFSLPRKYIDQPWRIIEPLAQGMNVDTYLEIGVRNADTFNRVTPHVNEAIGVDVVDCYDKIDKDRDANIFFHHQSSDEFFAEMPNSFLFDLVFIDGLHTAEQVTKDFINSYNRSNRGGLIILHDTHPPEGYDKPHLCGDVYRWRELTESLNKYSMITLPLDTGITIVQVK